MNDESPDEKQKAQDERKAVKLRKQRLELLQTTLNKVRMQVSMHKLTTYSDVLKSLGNPTTDDGIASETLAKGDAPITTSEYNKLIAFPLENKLRKRLKDETEGIHTDTKRVGDEHDQTNESLPTVGEATLEVGGVSDSELANAKTQEKDHTPAWWQEELPSRKCTLFKHQVKAAKELGHQLIDNEHRAALLRAGVGVGKTFIFFEFVRQLWDSGWIKGRTFSPWPVLIVTKASIVEQTKRVGIQQFGLDPFRQFRVTHYDALRSEAGSSMIENYTVVSDGIPYKKWRWHVGINPLVIILDECQSAKNEDSQQSQICQAISLIEDPNVKLIASSATPFTRVSEAKYFCINANIDYKVL